jgi:ankyrin repeat protein
MTEFNSDLTKAVKKADLDLVKKLIEQGADIHFNNDRALRSASLNGHLHIVKYLVNKGANIHIYDDEALGDASVNGHLDIVKYLIEQGVDIHANNDGALRNASYNGHLEVVKYLIDQGADITVEIDIPEEVQEIAIKRNPENIKNIGNLRDDLKEKYKHLLQAKGFGFFEDD